MGNLITIIKNSNTWIEGNAVQQLETTAKLPHIRRAAGMPDLHAGRGYPIGAAFFSVSHFYPALIGNDIGCGMAFWQTDLPAHKSKTAKLVKQLGSIDAPLDDSWDARISELLPQTAHRAALGTIGGGNHFAELQVVDTVYAPELLPEHFNAKCLQLLVHSGSRGLGQTILRAHVDRFGHAGLPENTPEAAEYLAQHAAALDFARANRRLIAERMLARWNAEGACLLDVHHNFLQPVRLDGEAGWLHRKGATPSDCGLVLIPGSRGDYSYLVRPMAENAAQSLFSLAHGAGRKWQRGECKGRLSHKYSADSLRQMLREAEAAGLDAEILSETPSKHGLMSAVVAVSGSLQDNFAQRWLGTLQWVCASPFRPNHARKNWFVAVSRLPDLPALPEEGEVRFETCRAGGKGGQHVNKTESAVRAVHTATGISVRVESERSQHANKKRALELLAVKLAAQHAEQMGRHAADAHAQLYQLERGNAVRVFRGKTFAE